MATLTIGNSFSQILGLNAEQAKSLKKVLSYQVGDFYSKWGPKTAYLIDKKGFFPSGLLPRVHSWLKENSIAYQTTTKNSPPTKRVDHQPLPTHRVPYNVQSNAVNAAVLNARGILSLPTGSGKSLVIALLIAKFGLRTLVIVPNLELKRQLTADLTNSFGNMSHIDIENIDSSALDAAADYDMLIIDEAHHTAAKTYQTLNRKVWPGIYHRFFLTATPFRNQKEETLLFEAIAGEVIYELTYTDAVSQGIIVPVEAYYIEIPKQKTDAYTWSQVYSQLVVNNKSRNETIALLLLRLSASQCHTLCLVKEVAHGNLLETLTGCPFANGQDDDTRRYIKDFSEGRLTSLIGTTGIVGEGVDTKPCEYVIICGLGKAKSIFLQQVGRGVRKHGRKETCKVIIIKDDSHKFTKAHFREQCKILKEYYGCIPVQINL